MTGRRKEKKERQQRICKWKTQHCRETERRERAEEKVINGYLED
jgi:hypothetical protein